MNVFKPAYKIISHNFFSIGVKDNFRFGIFLYFFLAYWVAFKGFAEFQNINFGRVREKVNRRFQAGIASADNSHRFIFKKRRVAG